MTVPQPPYQQPQSGPNPQVPGPQQFYPPAPQPGAYPPAPATKTNLGPLANPIVMVLAAVGVFGTLIGFLVTAIASYSNQFVSVLFYTIRELGLMSLVATAIVLALQPKKKP